MVALVCFYYCACTFIRYTLSRGECLRGSLESLLNLAFKKRSDFLGNFSN
jgi:hypothetical protein